MKTLIIAMMMTGLVWALSAADCCGCKSNDKEAVCKCDPCKCDPCGCKVCPSAVKTGCAAGRCKVGEAAKQSADIQIKMLDTEGVRKIVEEKGALIFDARTGKWDDGQRIPGAKSLSAANSPEEIAAAIPDKKQAVLVYCGSKQCPASAELAKVLIKHGYTNVMEYPDGIKGWRDAGMQVEKLK